MVIQVDHPFRDLCVPQSVAEILESIQRAEIDVAIEADKL
jgi:hypothetical protein